jgi:hypothetical protein
LRGWLQHQWARLIADRNTRTPPPPLRAVTLSNRSNRRDEHSHRTNTRGCQ